MERINVNSSNIKSIGYSVTKKLLEIEFKSGSVYQYKGVEPNVHMKLIKAESIGKVFGTMIKEKYKFKKI